MTVYNNERDHQLDFIRVLLMFSVIMAHFLGYLIKEHSELNVAMGIIQLYTMPMWCFLYGYFRKDTEKCRTRAVEQFLIPYFMFNFFIYTLKHFLLGTTFSLREFKIFSPQEAMWFLLSAFIWNLLLADLVKIRGIIFISIAIALLSGRFQEFANYLSLSRTFVFLPFVIAGYFVTSDKLDIIRKLPKGTAWAALGVSFLAACYFFGAKEVPASFLYFSTPFAAHSLTKNSPWYIGVAYRAIFLSLGILIMLAMVVLVPKKESLISRMGANTMAVYLLHLVFVYAAFYISLFEYINGWLPKLIVVTLLSAAINFILLLPAVSRGLDALLAWINRWLFQADRVVLKKHNQRNRG